MTIDVAPNFFSEHPPAGQRSSAALRRPLRGVNLRRRTPRELRRAKRLHPSYFRPSERSLDATHRLLLVEAWRDVRRGEWDGMEAFGGLHIRRLATDEWIDFWRYVAATRETHKARPAANDMTAWRARHRASVKGTHG